MRPPPAHDSFKPTPYSIPLLLLMALSSRFSANC
jgi:hypothetical protein